MLESRPIALVEPDARRRAQISHASAQVGLHVEPFENLGELQVLAEKRAILIYDEGRVLVDALEHCDRAGRWLPIVAYAAHPESIRVAEAIFAGALDYLAWPFSSADLGLSLQRIRERGDVVGKRRAEAAHARTKLSVLSGREHEVVSGMAEGLTNKAIAKRLQISPRTVEIHRSNAIGKLGATTSSEAIVLAFTAARSER